MLLKLKFLSNWYFAYKLSTSFKAPPWKDLFINLNIISSRISLFISTGEVINFLCMWLYTILHPIKCRKMAFVMFYYLHVFTTLQIINTDYLTQTRESTEKDIIEYKVIGLLPSTPSHYCLFFFPKMPRPSTWTFKVFITPSFQIRAFVLL